MSSDAGMPFLLCEIQALKPPRAVTACNIYDERENMDIKTALTWLQILGIPTIFTLSAWCVKKCIEFTKSLTILHSAQKAQMRSQLLDQYYKIKERGFVWADELDDWMNQYSAYHELVGENGVLDSRKDELTKFPSQVR